MMEAFRKAASDYSYGTTDSTGLRNMYERMSPQQLTEAQRFYELHLWPPSRSDDAAYARVVNEIILLQGKIRDARRSA